MAYKDIQENAPIRDYVSVTLNNAIKELENKNSQKLEPLNLSQELYHINRAYGLINDCSKRVYIDKCLDCGTRFFDKAEYCNHKLCPICARLRALKQMAYLIPAFHRCLRDNKRICFMTLTIKDTDNLEEGLDILERAWQYMTSDDAFSRYHFKKMFIGGIRSVEIKKGKNSKKWHPHMHLLVIKDTFSRDFDKLRGLWEIACQHVTGIKGKIGSVDIRGVKNRNGIMSGTIFDSVSIMHAVVECVKYITKFDFRDYTPKDLLDLCNAIYSRRTVNAFGVLYGIRSKLELKSGDDLVELKEIVCTECGCRDFDLEVVFDNKVIEDLKEFPKLKPSKLGNKIKKVSIDAKKILAREYDICEKKV